MTELNAMLTRISNNMGLTYDSGADLMQTRVDWYNKSKGKLVGYNCPECNNRGDFAYIDEQKYERYRPCSCMEIRRSMAKVQKSGLADVIKRYTFESYKTDTDWRRSLKERAEKYAKNPVGWFFIGGQVGCGKTHLCTAITSKLMRDGKSVLYMPWCDAIVPIKASVNEEAAYLNLMRPLKTIEVLYIDDLFRDLPTIADSKIAYEILNFRYNNSELITIISSERTMNEIMKLDLAVGSRIYERTKDNALVVGRDNEKNYRTSGGAK